MLGQHTQAVHRGCEPGEQYDANVCRKCQEQTYSFHPGDDGGQCQTCPDVAHCPGGPIFVPDDHYWHSSFDSDSAQRCPNTFACRCVACVSLMVCEHKYQAVPLCHSQSTHQSIAIVLPLTLLGCIIRCLVCNAMIHIMAVLVGSCPAIKLLYDSMIATKCMLDEWLCNLINMLAPLQALQQLSTHMQMTVTAAVLHAVSQSCHTCSALGSCCSKA